MQKKNKKTIKKRIFFGITEKHKLLLLFLIFFYNYIYQYYHIINIHIKANYNINVYYILSIKKINNYTIF